MNFINDNIKNIIKKGIDELYINLKIDDKQILYKYTTKLIEFLSLQYNFKNSDSDYEYQFIQNDYKDIKWLSTLLLPFLNVSQNQLTSFNDMYKKKYNETSDINKEEPKYIYTNLQYNRCDRRLKDEVVLSEEINFNEEHLKQNFALLLKSLLICSNKLYVNWINIIPYTGINFDTSNLFLSTYDLFINNKLNDINIIDFVNNDTQSDDVKKKIGSLYIGDIYNTLRTYLYEEIKNIKFLIFDLMIIQTKKLDSALPILNEFFYYDNKYILHFALQNISWDNLEESNKIIFSKKLDKLFYAFLYDEELRIDNPEAFESAISFYNIAKLSIKRLVKGMIINFDNKYRNRKNVIDSGYIEINANMTEEELDELDEDYDFSNIEQTIKSIKPEMMYNFLKEILQEFKTTFYSIQLLNDNKTEIADVGFFTKKYSLKNLYNFAKSLSHITIKKKYIILNRNWISLTNEEKKIILDRLNNVPKILDWFNITRYIKSLIDLGYIEPQKKINKSILETNEDIYNSIRTDIIRIVFEILIYKGILSKFIINREVSDKSLMNTDNISKYIAAKLKSKYFIQSDSNEYYLNANYYLTDLPYKYSGNYFDIVSDNGWYSMDPMEWVSQLGFTHHFINNRVLYVSGATGVGKSTHIPKLYLYYLKAIDYKSFGSVVCTQPRKTPTEKNADQVSYQMGVHIINKQNELQDSDNGADFSDYYYVQMQHKDKSHIKNNKHLVLKFITDGTLLQQFKELPPVFKRVNYSNKDNKQIKNITPDNLYDIVIIDEAHEHNKNMDMLLSVMRLFTYHNPSIRFVILSATLDEDEPNYRRYYRAINDNMKFPYDLSLKQYQLDRINIDRRYHISPPGAGTRFTVGEYYDDKTDIISLIKKLIKTQKGDILVFQPGESDIIKLIEELNKTIDSNWIALPFYSNMNDDKKNFIQNIDDELVNLKIDRTLNFNDIKNIYEGNNSYTNFILISTNIAEASITIRKLYYVIDTGTRKSNYYDYKRRNNRLLTTTISETSRVQRKGRVGRTGPGDAYFLYKKGITTNNKTPFEISISNVGLDLYSLMRNNNEEEKFDITKYKILKLLFETGDGIYDYIGNSTQNNYDFRDYLPEYYDTGYNINDIKDEYGKFYIIHPDELNLIRNIYGNVVGFNTTGLEYLNKKTGKFKSKKMESYFEDYDTMKYIDNDTKTELGINMTEMCEKLKLDSIPYARTLIYGLLLDEHTSHKYNDLMIGISILNSLNGDITKFLKRDLSDNLIIHTILGNNKDSDIEVIIDKIKQILEYISINKLLNFVDDILNGEIQFEKVKNIDRKKLKDIYINHIDYEDDDDNDIKREKLIDKLAENTYKKILKTNIGNKIDYICDKLEINEDIIKKDFIRTYIKIKENISHFFYTDSRGKNYVSFIEKYKRIYFSKNYNHYDLMKLSFMLSQPYNICLNILQTNGFLTLYNPTAENIINLGNMKTIDKNNKKKYMLTTFINDRFIRDYVFFDQYNGVRDSISVLFNINIKIIKDLDLFRNIYNKHRLSEITERYSTKINNFLEKLDNERKLKLKLSKDYDKIIGAQQSYNKILMDL